MSPDNLPIAETDFISVLRNNPNRLTILEIVTARMSYLELRLSLHIGPVNQKLLPPLTCIACHNAVDYSVRPPHPATCEGGPFIEFFEQHELLSDPQLLGVPGGDGEVFNPPLKLLLLKLDQSYVMAERFTVSMQPRGQTRFANSRDRT